MTILARFLTFTRFSAAALSIVPASMIFAQDSHNLGVTISDADFNRADLFVQDTSVLDGKVCIGNSCDVNEVFESDSIITLKDSNVGLNFVDTSGASFPSRDWKIQIGSVFASNSGGMERFAVADVTEGTTPFTLEGALRDHALYVQDDGDVGFGTNTPGLDLHMVSTDSPGVRFEQSSAGGNPAHIWDIAGNDLHFFVRDMSGGMTLPLKILNGAPTDAFVVDSDGDVGLGIQAPDSPLHIQRSNGTAAILVEDTGVANGNLSMMQLTNRSGRARMQFTSVGNPNQTGDWSISSGLTFVLQERLNGQNVFVMDNAGNLTITGELTTAGSCSVGCDRVFDADYALPSIAQHQAAMWQNGYLPNVGPTPEGKPFNVSDKMGRILNELEHAHIFIGQQDRRIAEQDDRIATLSQDNTALLAQTTLQQDMIAQLAARLDALEWQVSR